MSWYETGYVFRSGCVWKRGAGKVFYFQPGHETVPTYHNPYVRRILQNAAHYCKPAETGYKWLYAGNSPYIKSYMAPEGEIEELILALGATAEAEATSSYVKDQVSARFPEVRVTRLAQGIPLGAEVKYMDRETLRQSLRYRQSL